jgi:AcrR family transcriptional regulator
MRKLRHDGAMPPEPEIALISDGVFFTRPAPLPRGKHNIARDEVQAAQRERIMIAATELLAAHGHRAPGAREVCERAGVSLSAYYALFDDREGAIFAAYDRFIDVLLGRLAAVTGDEGTWQDYVEAVMAAYFDALSADLVVARAFQVELDGMGRPARERRRNSLGGLAAMLRMQHQEVDPGAVARIPEAAYVTGVYGVRQLASDALDRHDSRTDLDAIRADLDHVRADAVDWVTRLFGDAAT